LKLKHLQVFRLLFQHLEGRLASSTADVTGLVVRELTNKDYGMAGKNVDTQQEWGSGFVQKGSIIS
jgi:hypothetical protein